MRTYRRWLLTGVTGVGVGAASLTGCQTYPAGFGGMTLPSPHYLKHYPQYFPPDPPFPLQRELDAMQDPELLTRTPRPAVTPLAPLIPPTPPVPVPLVPGGPPGFGGAPPAPNPDAAPPPIPPN